MTEQEFLACEDPAAMLRAMENGELTDGRGHVGWAPGSGTYERKLQLVDAALLSTMGCNIPAIAFMVAHSQRSIACGILRDIVGNPFRPVLLPMAATVRNGEILPREYDICPYLTGTVQKLAQAAYEERRRRCENCDGYGKVIEGRYGRESQCPDCDGAGRINDGALDPDRLAILADALEEAGCLVGACPACKGDGGFQANSTWVPCGLCGEAEPNLIGKDPFGLITHLRSPGPHYRGCWALDLILGKE